MPATPTLAATFTVTSTSDAVDSDTSDGVCASAAGECTLRAAVQQANATPGTDTISIAAGTYTLAIGGSGEANAATGDLDLTGAVIINGNGSVISGGGLDRVFEVAPGASATINDVTVAGGTVTNEAGGGIFVGGSLSLNRSTILWNQASGSASYGGGVFFGKNATGGTIADSRIIGNSARYGAGVQTKKPVTITYSTIANNAATDASGGGGVGTISPGSVTLAGTLVTGNTGGGGECGGTGQFLSSGYNAARDLTCGLGQPTDLPKVVVSLDSGLHPVPGSMTIDAGGPCTGADLTGLSRPQGTACDIGAKELPAETRKIAVLDYWTNRNPVAGSASFAPDNLNKAYASYVRGNQVRGDAAIDALVGVGYPGAIPANLSDWSHFSVFPLMFRLEAVEQPSAYLNSTRRTAVVNWLREYTKKCSLSREFHNGIWTDNGSENHQLIRMGNCLLGTYALRSDATLQAIVNPDRGTWNQWADRMEEWLRERASTGGLSEVHFHAYGAFSLNIIHNVADLRGTTRPVDGVELDRINELAVLAKKFLDLTYHEFALEFDLGSGSLGTSGNRISQNNPDPGPNDDRVSAYNTSSSRRLIQWLHMYEWHSLPGTMVSPVGPAASPYVPLAISKDLARTDGKTFTAVQTSSGQACRGWPTTPSSNVCPNTQDPGERHGIVRQITSTDAYQMGAMTFDTTAVHNLAVAEAPWYSVNITTPAPPTAGKSNSILVSGVAELKNQNTPDSWMDYFAINGAVQGDVLIAARDRKASGWAQMSERIDDTLSGRTGNSRGIRVSFGDGDLRDNAVLDSGWWFTKVTDGNGTDVAYSAVRFGGDSPLVIRDAQNRVRELRMADDDPGPVCRTAPLNECCNVLNDPDCWAPVVLQMGRAGTGTGKYVTFQAFKDAVKAQPFSYTNGTLTYTGLNGDQVQMSRQQTTASLPLVKPAGASSLQPVNVNPSQTYLTTVPGAAPYLEMPYPTAVGSYGTAILRGPTGTRVDLDFNV